MNYFTKIKIKKNIKRLSKQNGKTSSTNLQKYVEGLSLSSEKDKKFTIGCIKKYYPSATDTILYIELL